MLSAHVKIPCVLADYQFVLNDVPLHVLYHVYHVQVSGDSGNGGDMGPLTPPDTSTSVIYEFDFPTQLCGLLIGRYGKHINIIVKESGSEIFVNMHPYTPTLQSVSIHGQLQSCLPTL